jgi:hypothetical protein
VRNYHRAIFTCILVGLTVRIVIAPAFGGDKEPAKPQSAKEIAKDWLYKGDEKKQFGSSNTWDIAPKESPKLHTSTTRTSFGSFEEAWNFYAKKCGSDKKYAALPLVMVGGETKDGQYVILDYGDADTGRVGTTFAYNTKEHSITVHLRPSEDKKNVYVSVTVALR